MRTGLILSLLLAILAVIFALQNPQAMDVNLLFFETQGSTALILILTFGLGVIVGLLSTLPKQLRTRRKLKELQKKQDPESKPSSSFTEPKSSSGSSRPTGDRSK
jgi:putative membrane protein